MWSECDLQVRYMSFTCHRSLFVEIIHLTPVFLKKVSSSYNGNWGVYYTFMRVQTAKRLPVALSNANSSRIYLQEIQIMLRNTRMLKPVFKT
jgi:hypothetical protein